MTQWRKEHPQATWAEIEAAVDERINQLRAQLIEDVVQMGESQQWSEMPPEDRPRCATCGPPNDGRGSRQGDAHVWHLPDLWSRLFSRLYEQLGLVSGGMTPRGEETLVRLASWMPYAPARELLEDLLGVRVSKATARRATLATGEAQLSVCEAEVERLKQQAPPAPAGAGKQALSGDGAMVHLVGGEWVARQDTGSGRGGTHYARGGLHAAALVLLAPE